MQEILARVRENRERQARELEEQGYDQAIIDRVVQEHQELIDQAEAITTGSKRRGMSAIRIIERAQLQLLKLEQRGDFTQHPITPGHELPTIFTRVPIFMPIKRGSAAKIKLDQDMALPFDTGWGQGRKFGSPLTTYDEDTLLALGALRQRQLTGMGNKMPVKVMNPFDPAQETHVDVTYVTISQIEEYLGNKKGGRGFKRRLESVKRLASVTLEFTKISDKRLEPLIKRRSFTTKIIDLVTEELENDSCLYVQFPPVMVLWLRENFTFINMDIRRQLRGDGAKAIHKFLSSQPVFNIGVEKLMDVMGVEQPKKEFMRMLRDAMRQLEALGWCEYDIEGNGRSLPFKLTGRQLRKTSNASSKE